MTWSAFQCEMLDAMGLSPCRMAGVAHGAVSRDALERHREGGRAAPASSADPLFASLLRAAGLRADAVDAADWAARWPSPQTLRGDGRAKRALWPQLRALRRRPQ